MVGFVGMARDYPPVQEKSGQRVAKEQPNLGEGTDLATEKRARLSRFERRRRSSSRKEE